MCALALLMVSCDGQPASNSKAAGNTTTKDASAEGSESETAVTKEMVIGSKAPPLDIEHWISNRDGQFKEVTTFYSGKVYVVEFWATWCGPCIASMPHLVELQDKFAQRGVQIISVSREDLATVKGLLPQQVQGSAVGDSSTYGELTNAYCLTADPDGSVHSDYMKAAKQRGIPRAFIVGKSGLIEWIGHPMAMDAVLEEVVSDQWDRDKFALEFQQSDQVKALFSKAARLANQGNFDEAQQLLSSEKSNFIGANLSKLEDFESRLKLASIEQTIQAGDVDEAIGQIETARKAANGKAKMLFDARLASLLLAEKRYDRVISTIDEIFDELPAAGLNALARQIYLHAVEPNEIAKELQNTAIKSIEKALEEDPTSGAFLDTYARLLHLSGDSERAFEVQTKALKNPGRAEAEIKAFYKQLMQERSEAASDSDTSSAADDKDDETDDQ